MPVCTNRIANIVTGVFAAAVAVMGMPGAAWGENPGFQGQVFPIIQQNCVECHQPGGAGLEKSGLDLTTYEGIMRGTRHGPIIVPGDSFTSNLSVLIEGRARPEINMPHAGKPLSRWQRVIIRRWINQGAMNN